MFGVDYAFPPMLDLFSGAVVTTTADGGVVLHSAPVRYVGWVLAFVILLPLSRFCWRRKIGGTLAPGFFFASFTIPLIVLPGIARERIEVSPRELSVSTGFWWAPTQRTIRFDRMRLLEERSEKIAQRRAERRDIFWIFHYDSGVTARLKLPDLLAANRESVLALFRTHGFTVQTL